MKKWILLNLLVLCFAAQSQTGGAANTDAERQRISAERVKLQAALLVDEASCYRRFWVNRCLDEVRVNSREALADLRRQEIVLNDETRKAKAAEQLQKIEDKSSPEKLQLGADKRAQAAKEFEETTARDKQKTADRNALQAREKENADASAERIKKNQDKAIGRAAKQAAEAEERKKYEERLAQAKERRERYARDKASQTKAPAQPLPVPQ